ncbi:creatininase family protein [Aquiflexum sp.]|uniref:creatininase family protein n=1 Tax=Aquiflexum sp. TaxID=1872584 RepID=UPI0035940FB6
MTQNKIIATLILLFFMAQLSAQTNPLWSEKKVKNYLPHMTTKEVAELLEKSDMVIIPIAAMEQHGDHLPMGTDFINGIERSKLIAQERDVLVAPVLFAGQSPYHMGFPGTISLKAETILQVHLEAVDCLIKHGFKRFMIMNSHGGNTAITGYLVDQINQNTSATAVNFEEAIRPFFAKSTMKKVAPLLLDRHAGTPETSNSLYLMPDLVQLELGKQSDLALPSHLRNMIPLMLEGDPTATLLFLSEGLKAEETGKKTSTLEMTPTGVWGEVNPKEATVERGRENALNIVKASVQFIDKWNELVSKK